jgi:hypothetical protein
LAALMFPSGIAICFYALLPPRENEKYSGIMFLFIFLTLFWVLELVVRQSANYITIQEKTLASI